MYKKLALTLVALIIVMVAIYMPVLAEPESSTFENVSSVEELPSESASSEEPASSEPASSEEPVSSEQAQSTDSVQSESVSSEDKTTSTESSSKVSSYVSKYYIPDDSTYFTESLNSLGGNVTSGSIIIGDEGNTSSTLDNTSSYSNNEGRFSLQDTLKKFLWIPIAIVAICVLVLIIFNRVYDLKYKAIDPAERLKAQKKADERRRAAAQRAAEARRSENRNGNNGRPRE